MHPAFTYGSSELNFQVIFQELARCDNQCSCTKLDFILLDIIGKCSWFIQVVILWSFGEHLPFPIPDLLMDNFEVVHYMHFCSQSLVSFQLNAHNMLNMFIYHQLLI